MSLGLNQLAVREFGGSLEPSGMLLALRISIHVCRVFCFFFLLTQVLKCLKDQDATTSSTSVEFRLYELEA